MATPVSIPLHSFPSASLNPSDQGPGDTKNSATSVPSFPANDVQQAYTLGALAARAQFESELNTAPPPYTNNDNASVRTFNTFGTSNSRPRKLTIDEKAAQDLYIGWAGATLNYNYGVDSSDKSIRSVNTTQTSFTTTTGRTGYRVPGATRARSRASIEYAEKVYKQLKGEKTKKKWSLKKTVEKVLGGGGKSLKESKGARDASNTTPTTSRFNTPSSTRERKISSKSNFEFSAPARARIAATRPPIAGKPSPFLYRELNRPRKLSTASQGTFATGTTATTVPTPTTASPPAPAPTPAPSTVRFPTNFNVSSVDISLLVAASRSANEYRTSRARAQRVRRSRSFSGFTLLSENRSAAASAAGEGADEPSEFDVERELAALQSLFLPKEDDLDAEDSASEYSSEGDEEEESRDGDGQGDEQGGEDSASVKEEEVEETHSESGRSDDSGRHASELLDELTREAQELLEAIGVQWEYV